MKTRLYAELRQSIRCISLSIEVQDRAQLEGIEISDSGEQIHVRFKDGSLTVMDLPARGQKVGLPIPQSGVGEMQFRIPLHGVGTETHLAPTAVEVTAPWCERDLESNKKDITIHCRNCQSCIVEAGVVKEWRALPSSGWAEMMDLWHCHKPTEDISQAEKEGQTMKQKYGGGFIEKSGIGLVGLTELMVHESDCLNIEIKEKDKKKLIHCEACGSEFGEIIRTNPGLRSLTKWSLAINADAKGSRTRDLQQFAISAFVGVRLLTLIEEQAVRHFFLPPPPGFNHLCGMRVWVFHPDVTVSSFPAPVNSTETPFRAMKIFYIIDSELDARDDFKEDTMQLPVSAWKALRDDLIASTSSLPANERKWKEWTIGLIQRF